MRDNYCDIKELEEDIIIINKRILRNNKDISEIKNDIVNGVNRYPISNLEILDNKYKTIVVKNIDKIRAMYSKGDLFEDFDNIWHEAVEALINIKEKKMGYLYLLWIVGIGILLEVPKDDMKKVEEVIKKDSIKDFVLQFLLDAYLDNSAYQELCFEKENPYKKVVEIVKLSFEDKKEASKRLTKYMNDEWFKGHYDYEWRNAHKEPGYLGFWSFETAALAKMLELDDSNLKDNIHYPYDLAHYKNAMKFNINELNIVEENEKEQIEEYIDNNHELEQIIPNKFRNQVNCIIEDYNKLEDIEFWKKYNLQDIWFDVSEYIKENAEKNLLGLIIVNALVDEGYILQLDYKEELEDYIGSIKNLWGEQQVKLIRLDLENDQNYYMYVPKTAEIDSLYEVKILNV